MLTSFQVAPQVLREVIAGEVVIINMMSGSYYSLTDVGTFVWEMLEQGFSQEAIVNTLLLQYDAELDTIETALMVLIESLVTENLLTSVMISEDRSLSNTELMTELNIEVKKSFIPPILGKYDDMQELLLVDPIHDVDESGWPNLKQTISV